MPSRSAVLARTDSPLDCPARWVRRRGAKRSKSPKGKLAWWVPPDALDLASFRLRPYGKRSGGFDRGTYE